MLKTIKENENLRHSTRKRIKTSRKTRKGHRLASKAQGRLLIREPPAAVETDEKMEEDENSDREQEVEWNGIKDDEDDGPEGYGSMRRYHMRMYEKKPS